MTAKSQTSVTAWSTLAVVLCAGTAAHAAPQPDRLIALEQHTDELCRDSSDQDTTDICVVRDALMRRLRQRGWCWNEAGEPEYRAKWAACREDNRLFQGN